MEYFKFISVDFTLGACPPTKVVFASPTSLLADRPPPSLHIPNCAAFLAAMRALAASLFAIASFSS